MARFNVLTGSEVTGPYSPADLIRLPGITRETKVCPEFEVVDWKELREHPELDFLWRLRECAEKLYARNRELAEILAAEERKRTELERTAAEFEDFKARAEHSDARRVGELETEAAALKEQLALDRRVLVDLKGAISDREAKIKDLESAAAWSAESVLQARSGEQEALHRLREREASALREAEERAALERERSRLEGDLGARSQALEAAESALIQARSELSEVRKRSGEVEERCRVLERESQDLELRLQAQREAGGQTEETRAAALEALSRVQRERELERESGQRLKEEIELLSGQKEALRIRLEERAARLEAELELRNRELIRLQTHPDFADSRRATELMADLEEARRQLAAAREASSAAEQERGQVALRLAQREEALSQVESRLEEALARATKAESLCRTQQATFSVEEAERSRERELLARQLDLEKRVRSEVQAAGQAVQEDLKAVLEQKEKNEAVARSLSTEVERLQKTLVQKESALEMLEARLQAASLPAEAGLAPVGAVLPPPAPDPRAAAEAALQPVMRALEERFGQLEARFLSLGEKLAAPAAPAPEAPAPAAGDAAVQAVKGLEERLGRIETNFRSLGERLAGLADKLSSSGREERKKAVDEELALAFFEDLPRRWAPYALPAAVAAAAFLIAWLLYRELRSPASPEANPPRVEAPQSAPQESAKPTAPVSELPSLDEFRSYRRTAGPGGRRRRDPAAEGSDAEKPRLPGF